MSDNFSYDFDMDDVEKLSEDVGTVERIGTQSSKSKNKSSSSSTNKSSAKTKKDSSSASTTKKQDNKNQNQNQQQQTAGGGKVQPKITTAISSSQAGGTSTSQGKKNVKKEVDIDAAIQSLHAEADNNNTGGGGRGSAGGGGGNLDAQSKLLAALMAKDDDDENDNDEDAEEEFDINRILGISTTTTKTTSSSTIATSSKLAPKVEEDYVNEYQQQEEGQNQNSTIDNNDSALDNIMNAADAAIKQEFASPSSTNIKNKFTSASSTAATKGGSTTTSKRSTLFANAASASVKNEPSSTTQSQSQNEKGNKNFSVAAAPSLSFDQSLVSSDNNTIQVKTEVKLEDDDSQIQNAAASASPEGIIKTENQSQQQQGVHKLPPMISAAERHHIPHVDDLQNVQDTTLRNVYWIDAKEVQDSSSGSGGHQNAAGSTAGSVMLFGRIAVRENPQGTSTSTSAAGATPQIRGGAAVYKSICVRIPITRCVLILPKNPGEDSDLDVMREATALCRRKGIDDRSFKFVNRRYAFEEPDVPTEETRWLKLRYAATYPALFGANEQLPKFDHIKAVFGVNRSLLELLLIKRRFEGPGFLDITRASAVPVANKKSLCDFEFTTTSQKNVFVLDSADIQGIPPPPKLLAASIQLRTQLDASGKNHEIFAATIAMCHFDSESSAHAAPQCTPLIGIRQWSNNQVLPFDLIGKCSINGLRNVRTFITEGQLVRWILDTLREHDPDIIIGHNIVGFSLGVLFNRVSELRPTQTWSTTGRMNWRTMPNALSGKSSSSSSTSSFAGNKAGYWEKEVCAGRLLCDTYTLAKEYHRTSSYKLLSLARELELSGVFGPVLETHVEQPIQLLDAKKMNDAEELCVILGQDYNLALLCVRLTHKLGLVPLTKRLTSVAGTVWSRVLNGSRAERIEYLLMHAFHRMKFVTPDKRNTYRQAERRGRGNETTSSSTSTTGGGHKKKNIGDDIGGEEDDDDIAAALDVLGEGGDDEENDKNAAGNAEDGALVGAAAGRQKAKFKGGRVLEPKVGLYRDYILLLDFNSLYPSLIQEFNVCFTTVERIKGSQSLNDRSEPTPPSRDRLICTQCAQLPNAEELYPCPHKCVLPKVIRSLVEGRKAVRKLMKTERNPATLAQLEIRQKALKLTANSMYGCLGFQHSRFYAQKLAELVTQEGRRALESTVGIVNNIGGGDRVRVIYGDTDSVMVSTGEYENLDAVKRIAENIRREVNKRYRCLELGMDGVFRTLLLHKKKKYAALTVTDWAGAGRTFKQEVKGLEMVRRDWCKLSKEACKKVLDTALSPAFGSDDEVVETIGTSLERIAESILSGHQQLANFVIAKSIQRDPSAYRDAGTQPHVQVAIRMQERKLPVFPGDLIPYVICDSKSVDEWHAKKDAKDAAASSSNASAAASSSSHSPSKTSHSSSSTENQTENQNQNQNQNQPTTTTHTHHHHKKEKAPTQHQQQKAQAKSLAYRAFHEDEVKTGDVRIDSEWYLANQLYPPVLRLCEHIAGFTPNFLCDKLKIPKAVVGIQEENENANRNNQNYRRSDFTVAFKECSLEDMYPNIPRFIASCASCGMAEPQLLHKRAQQLASRQIPESAPPNTLPPHMRPKFFERIGGDNYVLRRIPWFVCANPACKNPIFTPGVIENTLTHQLSTAVHNFYTGGQDARSTEKYEKLVNQFSYLWRLFDIPPHPMTDEAERRIWSESARFIDIQGRFRSASEISNAVRSLAINRNGPDAENLKVIAGAKRIGQAVLERFLPHFPSLTVDLGNLFPTEYGVPEEDAAA